MNSAEDQKLPPLSRTLSVSQATALLLGTLTTGLTSNAWAAKVNTAVTVIPKLTKDDETGKAPLPKTLVLGSVHAEEFGLHRSHVSHASHASHYSGSGSLPPVRSTDPLPPALPDRTVTPPPVFPPPIASNGDTPSPKKTAGTQNDMPAGLADVIRIIEKSNKCSTFLSLVEMAELTTSLAGKGPFTVFAPSDDAFNKLPSGMIENLMKPENKKNLQAFINNHIFNDRFFYTSSAGTKEFLMASGNTIKLTVGTDNTTINGAKFAFGNRIAANGIVHFMDGVILSPESK